jgi:8-oxo-dGTP diphosphatase
LLDVWKIESFSGLPEGLEGQRIAWRSINDLEKKLFPPADLPVITALQLPSRCLITGAFTSTIDFESKLSAALNDGIRLVQLRLTHDWLKSNTLTYAHEIMQLCHRLCEQNSSKLMLNIPEGLKPLKGCGLHLNSRKLLEHGNRPGYEMVSASCHNRIELERAQSIGVDFALLSPVRETCSHPGAQALGWEAFSELVDDINIPVYALGGMSTEDTGLAWKSGGQGIAAIGAFWNQLH